VVCLNEDEARRDAADREAIVAALRPSNFTPRRAGFQPKLSLEQG
jgi:hypothetical protein